jgi:methylated-DNA-[protein]-cysteine S-methyltransferase
MMRTVDHPLKKEIDSPLGVLTLLASDLGLQALLWPAQQDRWRTERDSATRADDHPVLKSAAAQVRQYFAGERRVFDLPLDPVGTPFQCQVWDLLAQISYGQTTTYGQLAQSLGASGKAQAVGAANGRNPISIIVPCHRVIGHGGDLTGFAGGLDAKSYLLELERGGVPPAERPPQQGDLFL